ncbi:MAG TPA: DUF1254 domain-containing protein [Hyphomicrobiales bacterium]|nr:DUF1254 domain-containing protein [Hyphomicrobiales bacterium]
MGWLLALAAGVVLGLATHVATLLAVPSLVTDPAVQRLAVLGPEDAFLPLMAESDRPRVSFLDPAFRYRLCRFDLARGPVELRVPIGPAYTALTLYGRDGVPFFSINDRSAIGGMLAVVVTGPGAPPPAQPGDAQEASVAAPTLRGVALAAAMVPAASAIEAVETALSGARCSEAGAPGAAARP